MNSMFSAIGVALLLATGTVAAQQPPVVPQTTARPTTGVIEPNAIRDAAQRVVAAVDAGQVGKLWDEASAITKRSVTRDAFIAGIRKSRQPLGKTTGRNWLSVRREFSDGKAVPQGLYASTEFLVEFVDKRTMRETVSFRLDEDGTWRFAGYAVQP